MSAKIVFFGVVFFVVTNREEMLSHFSTLFYLLLLSFSFTLAQKPRAFIHLGPHKTGSTTIQHAIKEASAEALPQGISTYPSTVTKHLPFPKFGRALSENEPLDPFIKMIQKFRKNDTDWLLSSESLDMPLNHHCTDRLAEIFAGYDVTIVAYYRNPIAHARSYWEQLSCFSSPSVTFPDFLNGTIRELMEWGNNGWEENRLDLKKWMGWELFGTLARYMRSFGIKPNGEGGGRVVLIDFDGVLEAGKSLEGVLFEEVVGLKNIAPVERVGSGHAEDLVTILNIWVAAWKKKRSEGGELEFPGCKKKGMLLDNGRKIRQELEKRGELRDCTEVVDFGKWEERTQEYFSRKLKESGLSVMYGGAKGKWGLDNCKVVVETE